jgi:hypothetical protein
MYLMNRVMRPLLRGNASQAANNYMYLMNRVMRPLLRGNASQAVNN